MILATESPIATPDSLRAFLQLSKRFYELHTVRNLGYKDIDGFQYVGTTENFGSEILLESRKLRMMKPPVDLVRASCYVRDYFDITQSDFINTYDQQNMMMCTFKRDILDPKYTYHILFEDVEEVIIPRSEADGDFTVKGSRFYRTTTLPSLVVTDKSDDTYSKYTIAIGTVLHNTDQNTTFYFSLDRLSEKLIGPYQDSTNDFITVDMAEYPGIPCLWVCVNDMRMLPPLVMTNNVDRNGHPILVPGTNGQATTYLYPFAYGRENLPDPNEHDEDEYHWYIKAYGDFTPAGINNIHNFNVPIKKIEIILMTNEFWTAEPYVIHTIKFDDVQPYTRITLTEPSEEEARARWWFRTPSKGQFDYDGVTYNNVTCAYTLMKEFEKAYTKDQNPLIPAFRVRFDEAYYHKYEGEVNQFLSGIHVDYTTDYSDHSVDKKFGVIHGLSDFDGLPKYFKYFLDRTIHRAHVEMYAIRNHANNRNQKSTDKQTAAIILDSAVPQNDLKAISDDMQPVIVYSKDKSRTYVTNEDAIVSLSNQLTDIVLVDAETLHFADCNIEGYHDKPRFVYHGNRSFSMDMIDFDPDLEISRGYLITNDPASYDNNETSCNPKAPRTVARICDVPTSMAHLVNITGKSPTLVIDNKYVRQEASFTQHRLVQMDDDIVEYSNDFTRLWNDLTPKWIPNVTLRNTGYDPFRTGTTFSSLTQLRDLTGSTADLTKSATDYSAFKVPSFLLDLTHEDDYSYTLSSAGEGYATGDKFGFNIGGVFFRGIVVSISDDGAGHIETFQLILDDEVVGMIRYNDTGDEIPTTIPLSNFDGPIVTFETETILGNGRGAVVKFEISENVWNSQFVNPDERIPRDGLYTFAYDSDINGIWIIPFSMADAKWDVDHKVQLTGDLDIGNLTYDDHSTRSSRTLQSVYLYNLLQHQNWSSSDLYYETTSKSIDTYLKSSDGFDPPSLTIEGLNSAFQDYSKRISDLGLNGEHTFFSMIPFVDNGSYVTAVWNYDANRSSQNDYIFPKRSGLNLNGYDGSMSGIQYAEHQYGGTDATRTIAYMYDPRKSSHDIYDCNASYITRMTERPMKVADVLYTESEEFRALQPLTNNDLLNFNLYRFNMISRATKLNELRENIEMMTTDQIQSKIEMELGFDEMWKTRLSVPEIPYKTNEEYPRASYIIDVDTNDLYQSKIKFTATSLQDDIDQGNLVLVGKSTRKQELINYYLSNQYSDSIYDKTDVELFKRKGESINDQVELGGYVPIAETVEAFATVSGNQKSVRPLYVFRIDDINEAVYLENWIQNSNKPEWYMDESKKYQTLKMYDGDEDISECVLLIINKKPYTFHDGRWKLNYHYIDPSVTRNERSE